MKNSFNIFNVTFTVVTFYLIISCSENPTASYSSSYALQFDGVDGYMMVDNDSSLNPGSAITIAMWIYLSGDIDCNDTNNFRGLLNKGWNWGETGYDIIIEEDRKITWSICTSGGVIRYLGNRYLPIQKWAFIAVTYDSATSQPKIYFDGTKIPGEYGFGSMGSGRILSNYYNLMLNLPSVECPTYEGNFPGIIDELSIWNVAMNAKQIQALMKKTLNGSEAGLISCWRFEEVIDNTVVDVANRNKARLFGDGVTWVESTIPINN